MKNFNYKNKNFIVIYIGIIVVSLILVVSNIKDKKNDNEIQLESFYGITSEEANQLYTYLSNVDCNKNIIWDFSEVKSLKTEQLSSDIKIKMVFSYIDSLDKLNSELTEEKFYNYASDILGETESKKLELVNQEYNGKLYLIGKTATDINKGNSCSESDYVSKLKNYYVKENVLSLEIAVAIKKDNTLYNINNDKIGTFSTKEEQDKLLDSSTVYIYQYVRQNKKMILYNVSS